MKKIFFSMLILGVFLNGEGILSTDFYLGGAKGKNISFRHYVSNDLYFKIARGNEKLEPSYDVIVEYDYNMIGMGFSFFEFYYKFPTNEVFTNEYISKEVDSYMGMDLVFEYRSSDFTFGATMGFFRSPKLKYKEFGSIENADIRSFVVGFRIGYTFGAVDNNYLRNRNNEVRDGVNGLNEGFKQNNNYHYNSTPSYRIEPVNMPSLQSKSRTKSRSRFNSKSSGCSSDISCGMGYKCVKAQYSSSGTCMKSVNKFGVQQYGIKRDYNIGVNMNKQCTIGSACPVGFRCIGGNCIR